MSNESKLKTTREERDKWAKTAEGKITRSTLFSVTPLNFFRLIDDANLAEEQAGQVAKLETQLHEEREKNEVTLRSFNIRFAQQRILIMQTAKSECDLKEEIAHLQTTIEKQRAAMQDPRGNICEGCSSYATGEKCKRCRWDYSDFSDNKGM